MPAQPAWFHRLDEILSELRALHISHLDRLACEKLFRVRQRRARQLMAGLPALRVGNAVAVERQALIARLEKIQAGERLFDGLKRRFDKNQDSILQAVEARSRDRLENLETTLETRKQQEIENITTVLDELERLDESIVAYEQAVALAPHYADAHYNLALAFERKGQNRPALRHWQAYLRIDNRGPWADHARERIAKLLGSEKLAIAWRADRFIPPGKGKADLKLA